MDNAMRGRVLVAKATQGPATTLVAGAGENPTFPYTR